MAIGTPVHSGSAGVLSGTSVATSSFTPAANTVLFAFGWAYKANGTPAYPSITDSLGNTWIEVPAAQVEAVHNTIDRGRGSLYYFVQGASPAARTVTVTSAGAGQCGLTVIAVPMGAPDVSNVATGNDGQNGDPSATLSGSPAAALAWAAVNGVSTFTIPSGYTSLVNSAFGSVNVLSAAYDLTSPGATQAWTSSNSAASVAIGIELIEAAAAGQPAAKRMGGVPYARLNRYFWRVIDALLDGFRGVVYG